jgi:Domain of unknown function (DUF4902)
MTTTTLLVRQFPTSGLGVCSDGYIRLAVRALHIRTFVQLYSALDEEEGELPFSAQGATATGFSGFTEWATETLPSLSLGWDWTLAVTAPRWSYRMVGEPRSNIQLIDENCRDLAYADNLKALAVAVAGLDWQAIVASSLLHRYR